MSYNIPKLHQRYLETRHRERRGVDVAVQKEYEESLLVMDDNDLDDNGEVNEYELQNMYWITYNLWCIHVVLA